MIKQDLKYIFLTLVFIIVGISFVKNTQEIISRGSRPAELSEEIADLESVQQKLQVELEYKTGDLYIERQARNNLNLVKPNELIYVVDPTLNLSGSGNASSTSEQSQEYFKSQDNVDEDKSNFRQWIDLLLF